MAQIELNTEELVFIKNILIARKAYKSMKIPFGAVVWDDMQEKLFDKVILAFNTGD